MNLHRGYTGAVSLYQSSFAEHRLGILALGYFEKKPHQVLSAYS